MILLKLLKLRRLSFLSAEFHSKEYLWGVFRRRKTSGHKSLGSNL